MSPVQEVAKSRSYRNSFSRFSTAFSIYECLPYSGVSLPTQSLR
jgi:hypothetical protein